MSGPGQLGGGGPRRYVGAGPLGAAEGTTEIEVDPAAEPRRPVDFGHDDCRGERRPAPGRKGSEGRHAVVSAVLVSRVRCTEREAGFGVRTIRANRGTDPRTLEFGPSRTVLALVKLDRCIPEIVRGCCERHGCEGDGQQPEHQAGDCARKQMDKPTWWYPSLVDVRAWQHGWPSGGGPPQRGRLRDVINRTGPISIREPSGHAPTASSETGAWIPAIVATQSLLAPFRRSLRSSGGNAKTSDSSVSRSSRAAG